MFMKSHLNWFIPTVYNGRIRQSNIFDAATYKNNSKIVSIETIFETSFSIERETLHNGKLWRVVEIFDFNEKVEVYLERGRDHDLHSLTLTFPRRQLASIHRE